ncbi:hypothetical protein K438DRAFT_2000780 [Mycena galopus ATCC 62051]|nr:hypothetical protein K438DRAFT_2000780 [Mycena galopus ATCC 62051]
MRLPYLQLVPAAFCSTAYTSTTAKVPFYITVPFRLVDRDGEEGLNCPAANETAVPLATALGINISTCATGDGADDDCPNNTLQKFNKNSDQSVLFVWDSTDMEDLLENLDTDAGLENDQLALHPDLILAVNPKDLTNVGVTSMNCTGIDGTAV